MGRHSHSSGHANNACLTLYWSLRQGRVHPQGEESAVAGLQQLITDATQVMGNRVDADAARSKLPSNNRVELASVTLGSSP
jgi:hypothetical protein